MSLFESSVHGLRARVSGLRDDLARWAVRTGPDGELPRHHTHVRRLGDYLDGTVEAVLRGTPADLDGAPPFAGTVDDVPELRRSVGSIHLLWDFFRDKLAQRDLAEFGAHLAVADDLAWACYEPMLRAAVEAHGETPVKEPPLVFYSTDRSPFAQARSKTLHPPGLDAEDLTTFAAALQRLPVPVIGIPWEIANRMPETALVGHEAGHVIAEDLGLAAEARAALREAAYVSDPGNVRRGVWQAWCDEVLADVIGVLATGGAFVAGLSAELAAGADEIRLAPIDARRPGRYPTAALRVALCEGLLGRLGVESSPAWSRAYGPLVGDSRGYRDDLAVVAEALLGRPWAGLGGRRLAAILPWDDARERSAREVGAAFLAEEPSPAPFDVRVWVAAAAHARRADPGTYAARGLDAALAGAVVARRDDGIRSTPEPCEAPGRRAADRRAADRQAGRELARSLGLGHPKTPSGRRE